MKKAQRTNLMYRILFMPYRIIHHPGILCYRRDRCREYRRINGIAGYLCGLFLFAILAAGCATSKTPPLQKTIWEGATILSENTEGVAQELLPQEIVDTVISRSSQLAAFRANVEMSVATPQLKGPVRCTGIIQYQSPQNLRIVGSKFASTLFDISSDGDRFWLYAPQENRCYTGRSDTFHRIETLGINIFPGDMALLFNYKALLEEKTPAVEIWPAYWLVHVLQTDTPEACLKGNLYIDRVDGGLFRCEVFNPDGSVRLQALFTNPVTINGCRVPQRIDVRWPVYSTTLSMTFSNITINVIPDPKVFSPAMPKETETVDLN